MPAVPSESVLYSPLTYYQVKATVIPLPRSLNEEAERQTKEFLLKAAVQHSRFLVLAPRGPSMGVLDYVAYYAQSTHSARPLGCFDDVWVVEFVPYSDDR
jgi:hypothetical protein